MSDVIIIGTALSTPAAGVVTVAVGSLSTPAQCPRDLTVEVGDTLGIGKVGSAYYILARYFVAPNDVTDMTTDEPPQAPSAATGTTTFVPKTTASYRNGQWRTDTDDIIQGSYGGQGNHIGAAFYGSQLQSLGGATVLSAFLKAKRKTGGAYAAQSTTLVHITQSSRPSGAPTYGGSYAGPHLAVNTSGQVAVDVALVQAMVDGTYGGLGIHNAGSPYVRLYGLSGYAAAFALTVTWRRSDS